MDVAAVVAAVLVCLLIDNGTCGPMHYQDYLKWLKTAGYYDKSVSLLISLINFTSNHCKTSHFRLKF